MPVAPFPQSTARSSSAGMVKPAARPTEECFVTCDRNCPSASEIGLPSPRTFGPLSFCGSFGPETAWHMVRHFAPRRQGCHHTVRHPVRPDEALRSSLPKAPFFLILGIGLSDAAMPAKPPRQPAVTPGPCAGTPPLRQGGVGGTGRAAAGGRFHPIPFAAGIHTRIFQSGMSFRAVSPCRGRAME